MAKIVFLFTLCCVLMGSSSFLLPATESENENEKPNILLIVSDDNGQHLSSYGDTVIQTPNLDQIAKEGILFKNAYITQAVCSPSRSSILTGLYPHQNGHLGLTTHGFHFVGEIKTIYQTLKEAGYRTGMIGKLHLDPDSIFPIDDYPLKSPNYEKKGLGRYAEYASQIMNKSDDPFFLMVNFPDPHWPFQDLVEGRPANPVKPEDVVSFPYIGFDNERIRSYSTGIYNGMLRLDECVGELMSALKKSGKQKNTLVIYLSDHGDEMAKGKFDIYEASTKVPFLVTWPGKIARGVQSNALISSIDIVPTIFDVAGLPAQKNLPGKSLLSLFKKPNADFRNLLFTEKNADQKGMYFPRRAVRDKKYKLIYSLLTDRKNEVAVNYTKNKNRAEALAGSPSLEELEHAPDSIKKMYASWISPNQVQLYDLEKDPWEFHDLSNDPKYTKVKERLLKELFKWQKETNDPLRFPDKLKKLTQEMDTIKITKNMQWHYPEYLYGKN
jgi:N-sulfoglucosamine sulfohydrolase